MIKRISIRKRKKRCKLWIGKSIIYLGLPPEPDTEHTVKKYDVNYNFMHDDGYDQIETNDNNVFLIKYCIFDQEKIEDYKNIYGLNIPK